MERLGEERLTKRAYESKGNRVEWDFVEMVGSSQKGVQSEVDTSAACKYSTLGQKTVERFYKQCERQFEWIKSDLS